LERGLCVPVFFRQKPLVSGLDARFIHACSACVGAFIGAAYAVAATASETLVSTSAATMAFVVFANIVCSSFLLTYIKAVDQKNPLYFWFSFSVFADRRHIGHTSRYRQSLNRAVNVSILLRKASTALRRMVNRAARHSATSCEPQFCRCTR
jgi:hypothetical protein